MNLILVDFDKIRGIAHLGVSRAAVFMGLGLNAAHDKDFKDYRLSTITKVNLVPPDANDEQIEHFKKEFSYWIIGNGLREVIETFGIFLDKLHHGCFLLRDTKLNGGASPQAVQTAVKKFHLAGIRAKLATLKDEFQIEPSNLDSLFSINKARRCLTHRGGIVGQLDTGEDEKLHLKWRGMEMFVKTPDGEEITLIPGGLSEPLLLKDGGHVLMRFPERTKTFSRGEQLLLTPADLTEFCQIIVQETDLLCTNALAYAGKLGIPHIKYSDAGLPTHPAAEPH
jgi:hypothetical protein